MGAKRRRREITIRSRYGISLERAEELYESGCAICGSFQLLRIDHEHGGEVRGCLCHACNIGVGFIERPGGWLVAALKYLRLV